MLRVLILGISLIGTFVLGSWAYKINYETRAAKQRVKALEKSIQISHQEIKILHAEWAHLNTPQRLRKLVEYYFKELRLGPINPDDFISYSRIFEQNTDKAIAKQITNINPTLVIGDE